MVDLTQAHKASIELLGTRHTALVEAVRNYVNGSVQPSIDELIAAIEDVTTDIDTKEKMLLGLASRQATKPVPNLILDFKTRHYLQGTRRPEKGYGFHDLLTVKRATPKWVYNASGKLVEIPADEPAYDHDPVTGKPLGVLIEDSRTNLIPWSEDFSAWSGGSAYSVTVNASGAPDGGAYQTVTKDSPGTLTSGVIATLSDYAFTVYVKNPVGYTGNWMLLAYNNTTQGSVKQIAGVDGATGDISLADEVTELPGGWKKITGVVRPDMGVGYAAGDSLRFYANSGGNTEGGSLDIWGAQLEQGPFPTSYIPTYGAPVTRERDAISASYARQVNPRKGTYLIEVPEFLYDSTYSISPIFSDSTGTEGSGAKAMGFAAAYGSAVSLYFHGVYWTDRTFSVPLGTKKIAASYNVDTGVIRMAGDGQPGKGTGSSVPITEIPSHRTTLYFMDRTGDGVKGHFTGCMYFPFDMSQSELEALTAL